MNTIHQLLRGMKFSLHNEKTLQREIYETLIKSIPVQREYRLDDNNIIDFFHNGIGVEIKINGNRKNIFKQCQRYCEFDQITGLILVTNRAMGFPKSLNNKPCMVINLGLGWL